MYVGGIYIRCDSIAGVARKRKIAMENITFKVCVFIVWMLVGAQAILFVAQRTAQTCMKNTVACQSIAESKP